MTHHDPHSLRAVPQRSKPSAAILLILAVVAACGTSDPTHQSPATGSPAPGASPDTAVAARLAQALDGALADSGASGAQAAVVLADGSLWTAGAGSSTPGRPMTPDLLNPLASVTKVYTASLILDLAEDGVLSLDDPLEKWLPDAANARGVSIRQLLSHTSGIPSDDPSLQRVCEPGTCYSYSNSGFNDLGLVIEAATGKPYAEVLHDRVLRPLGLAATFFPPQETAIGESATGHSHGEDRTAVDLANELGPGAHGASGAIVATAADTARFVHDLSAGSVLEPASLDTLLDVESTRGLPGTNECTPAAAVSYHQGALGESWFHGGNMGLFRSWVEHYVSSGLTIAVIVNADVPAGPVVERLGQAALAGAPSVPAGEASGRCEDDIAIRTADGTTRLLVSDVGFDGMPSWSPDARRLVWVGLRDDQTDLFVGDVATGSATHLTDDPARDLFPDWSPDGSLIAFSSNRDGDFEIYLMDRDGSDVRQLTHDDVDEFAPSWSPDSARIAYVRQGDGQHIRVMAADGSDDRTVTSGPMSQWYPTWSPDGQRLAYESGGVIFVVPVDGGDSVRLPIPQVRVTTYPSWAPASDIVFSSDGDLYSASEDGSHLVRLTASPTWETTPAWSPDGSSIAFGLSRWVASGP